MNGLPFILIGLGIGINVMNVLNWALDNTYRDGAIQCLQGKIEYELKVQKDGTTRWEYVGE